LICSEHHNLNTNKQFDYYCNPLSDCPVRGTPAVIFLQWPVGKEGCINHEHRLVFCALFVIKLLGEIISTYSERFGDHG